MSDQTKAFRVTPEGLLLFVRVTPNADRDAVMDQTLRDDGRCYLNVKVRAVPDKGKANKAVISLLAKYLGLPKTQISVRSGTQSRTKSILVLSDTPESLVSKLDLC